MYVKSSTVLRFHLRIDVCCPPPFLFFFPFFFCTHFSKCASSQVCCFFCFFFAICSSCGFFNKMTSVSYICGHFKLWVFFLMLFSLDACRSRYYEELWVIWMMQDLGPYYWSYSNKAVVVKYLDLTRQTSGDAKHLSCFACGKNKCTFVCAAVHWRVIWLLVVV